MKPFFKWNYKKFDDLISKEALNGDFMKHDVNNINYSIFPEIVLLYVKLVRYNKRFFGETLCPCMKMGISFQMIKELLKPFTN